MDHISFIRNVIKKSEWYKDNDIFKFNLGRTGLSLLK